MFDTQTILFGQDPTEGMVAVEVAESEATLYIRAEAPGPMEGSVPGPSGRGTAPPEAGESLSRVPAAP